MNIRIPVPFEDINWESWAQSHNLRATLEPRCDGLFELNLVGHPTDINNFRVELGY